MQGLAGLREFNVSSNQLSGSMPLLDGLHSLQNLFLDNNQLTGPMPALPSPDILVYRGARLCPNHLEPRDDPQWDDKTGEYPWYQNCTAAPDLIFTDGFEVEP